MSSKLTDARRSLVRAKESAEARLKQLDEERSDIRSSIKSLEAAIKALDGSKTRTARPTPPTESA